MSKPGLIITLLDRDGNEIPAPNDPVPCAPWRPYRPEPPPPRPKIFDHLPDDAPERKRFVNVAKSMRSDPSWLGVPAWGPSPDPEAGEL